MRSDRESEVDRASEPGSSVTRSEEERPSTESTRESCRGYGKSCGASRGRLTSWNDSSRQNLTYIRKRFWNASKRYRRRATRYANGRCG